MPVCLTTYHVKCNDTIGSIIINQLLSINLVCVTSINRPISFKLVRQEIAVTQVYNFALLHLVLFKCSGIMSIIVTAISVVIQTIYCLEIVQGVSRSM